MSNDAELLKVAKLQAKNIKRLMCRLEQNLNSDNIAQQDAAVYMLLRLGDMFMQLTKDFNKGETKHG